VHHRLGRGSREHGKDAVPSGFAPACRRAGDWDRAAPLIREQQKPWGSSGSCSLEHESSTVHSMICSPPCIPAMPANNVRPAPFAAAARAAPRFLLLSSLGTDQPLKFFWTKPLRGSRVGSPFPVPSSPCASIPVPSSNLEPLVLFHRRRVHNSPLLFRPCSTSSCIADYCLSVSH
jgi:hypothetical protein